MNNIALKLTAFEGPLDLLMHLIETNKVDIYDIPIVEITEQYIAYLRNLQDFDMELASEFLVMAATLLQIKSRMLLPKEERPEDEEEADPRQQLVEMLIEYRRIKAAVVKLRYLKEQADRYGQREGMFANLVERTIPSYPVSELLKALGNVLRGSERQLAYIEPQAFSVQEKMAAILQRLEVQPQGFLLNELFQTGKAGEKVAAFLGVLELLKLGLVTISQKEAFAPIYIFTKHNQQQEEAVHVS
ncbi:MAG: segregation/condensation protein A [Phascolarctobacterium sp.]|nr:segregation/condensation protein A [Phascolarctobacterium sp.]